VTGVQTCALPIHLTSAYTDFNKESLVCEISCNRQRRNIVLPPFILRRDKKKFIIKYVINGKNLSGRAYTCQFKNVEISNGKEVVARSKDTAIFVEQYVRKTLKDAVSPLYGTGYVMALKQPEKMELQANLEFDLKNKYGTKESFVVDIPLKKIREKGFSLFNPFK